MMNVFGMEFSTIECLPGPSDKESIFRDNVMENRTDHDTHNKTHLVEQLYGVTWSAVPYAPSVFEIYRKDYSGLKL